MRKLAIGLTLLALCTQGCSGGSGKGRVEQIEQALLDVIAACVVVDMVVERLEGRGAIDSATAFEVRLGVRDAKDLAKAALLVLDAGDLGGAEVAADEARGKLDKAKTALPQE